MIFQRSFPLHTRRREIFWNIIASRIKKKRYKKEGWCKVFRDTRSDFLQLLRDSLVQGTES